MRPNTLTLGLVALAASATAAADSILQTASIYIQPVVHNAHAPELLAEIRYNPIAALASATSWVEGDEDEREDEDDKEGHSLSSSRNAATVTNYQAPDLYEMMEALPSTSPLMLRVGVYDPSAGAWVSSTSLVSASNFEKGYAPRFMLTVMSSSATYEENGKGASVVVGAALRGVLIDAGHTRDFGPRATLKAADGPGRQPDLNKPVVLNPDGKKAAPPEEKSMIQKYWWVIAIVMLLSLSGGGGEEGK